MEFTQGGDIGAEKHLVAHVRVLVGVQETYTVANSERVSRSLVLQQWKLPSSLPLLLIIH